MIFIITIIIIIIIIIIIYFFYQYFTLGKLALLTVISLPPGTRDGGRNKIYFSFYFYCVCMKLIIILNYINVKYKFSVCWLFIIIQYNIIYTHINYYYYHNSVY